MEQHELQELATEAANLIEEHRKLQEEECRIHNEREAVQRRQAAVYEKLATSVTKTDSLRVVEVDGVGTLLIQWDSYRPEIVLHGPNGQDNLYTLCGLYVFEPKTEKV